MLGRIAVTVAVAVCLAVAAPSAWARKLGPSFQVNNHSSTTQNEPSVARLNDGGFVVVWQGGGDGDGAGIFGQRFDGAANRVGTEFPVNTRVRKNQTRPSVAAWGSSGFVVVWESFDHEGAGVFGQLFGDDGNRTGNEFRVNSTKPGDQSAPAVAALSTGGFVVVWHSDGQDGSGYGVYGRRHDASGKRIGKEFRVNTTTEGNQMHPAVAPWGAGGFVVVWQSEGQDGDENGIYGQRYRATGRAGKEFQANTSTIYDQSMPAVAALGDGGFVVVWQGFGEIANYDIYGQRFAASGKRFKTQFRANDNTFVQQKPTVASFGSEGFVVFWESCSSTCGTIETYGQGYSRGINTFGHNFRLSPSNSDRWSAPSVAPLGDGFVAVGRAPAGWIYGQRFDAARPDG
jgi:hypothetical protein